MVIVRGVNRAKRPAIGWGASGESFSLVNAVSFGDYADTAALLAAWSENNPGAYSFTRSTERVHDGGASLKCAMGTSGAGGDVYVAKAFSGFTPGAIVEARAWCWLNTDFGDDAHWVGVRVGSDGTPAYVSYLETGAWRLLRARGVANGSGSAEVQLGAFATTFSGTARTAFWGGVSAYEVTPAAAATLLTFAEPLDSAMSWPRPRAGFGLLRPRDGAGPSIWHLGVDELLSGVARWIPLFTGIDRYGTESTGWHGTPGGDGSDGVRAWLAAARDQRPFIWYPDRDTLAGGVECVLVDPLRGPPEPEGNRHVRQPLTIRATSGGFTGY